MYEKLDINTGKSEAVETFIRKFYPSLQQYCRFLAQSSWDGDDLAQEVMIKAIEHYLHLPKVSPALLNKMAYHQWIDWLRKRKHEEMDDLSNVLNRSEHKSSQTMEIIEELVSRLTPNQALVFVLKYGFQYKSHEIAKLLGTTETAIKSALHRGKKRLEAMRNKSNFADNFWSEEQHQLLSKLFHQALKEEDPTSLIEAISENPVLWKQNLNQNTRQFHSSFSNSLSMAA